MLWCNNLKLENSHRTKSGTKSGRHIQLKFMELPFNLANFSSGNGFRASMGLLGVPWKAHDENRKGNKIKRVTVIMKPRKTYRSQSPLGTVATHSGVFSFMNGTNMAGHLDHSHSTSHSVFSSSTQILATSLFPFACDTDEFLYWGQVPNLCSVSPLLASIS